ncbi:MAG TPA: SDR family NAD(P)-dependent oxidoreductase [Candidatus Acidoferrum sp.]|nr:SDR family NAD(P)-dependent oxidoreductase [Candidatus Acidoferrum sp.]
MNESDERTALVTGGTDGIGRAVALDLARGGDRVLFVGRSEARGAQVLAALRELRPGVEHAFIRADLSLLAETARVAEEVGRRAPRLDAAVFCAGLLSTVPEWTEEGLERNFVLNYLTRYLMARRLLPALTRAPSGRVVLVANAGKYGDTLDLEDLQHRRGKPGLHVAGRTQFANDLLATELASQVRGTRVEVTCVFPGLVRTSVMRNARGMPWIVRALARLLHPLLAMSPAAGAQTPVFLARSPAALGSGGRFYGPRRAPRPIPARASQPARRRGLWAASEQLVRAYLPD